MVPSIFIFQPSSLVGFGLLCKRYPLFPPNPPEKRAEPFNRIVSSRQFVGCLNKTTEAETTAATNRRTQGRLEFSLQGLRITSENHIREPIPSARWGNGEARLTEGTLGLFELLLSGHLSWDRCV